MYQTVHHKFNSDFSQWIKIQHVSQMTVYHYMAFSSLIMRFPGLILSDLKLSQLLKHKECLLTFLFKETNSKLAHQHEGTVSFVLEQNVFKLMPVKEIFLISME